MCYSARCEKCKEEKEKGVKKGVVLSTFLSSILPSAFPSIVLSSTFL